MEQLAPFPVALPFIVAALIAAVHRRLPRRALDVLAVATSLTVFGLCVALALASGQGALVHWFGGWMPSGREPIGISFTVQPWGAWFAALAALLVSGSFVFSWRFFEDMEGLYHGIMLVFLGGMCGFCLTGDLFNLFVFFEVMGVSAFALTGYKNDLRGAIQGAVSFAVTNSFAAILLLFGIALVYAKTGTLNMARAGDVLASQPADALILTAFALVCAGLLTKAATFPFHLWLPDAHTVAPAPVSVLFSGVMVLLGFWGVAHLYWIVFHGVFAAHEHVLRRLLLSLAILSAIGGAFSALLQVDLKRSLAFSTISHGGLILAGIALLSEGGLAGAATNLIGEGLLKGALFMIAGRLLNRHGTTDIRELHGRARKHGVLAALWIVATLGLCGLPGFVAWAGESFIEEAARQQGLEWIRYPLLFASAVASAALLAAGGHIFFGWGPKPDEEREAAGARSSDERGEQQPTLEMTIAPAVLIVIACALTFVHDLGRRADQWSSLLTHSELTREYVLTGQRPPLPPLSGTELKWHAVVPGLIVALASVAFAALWLGRKRLPKGLRKLAEALITPLHQLQSGDVRDYLLWMGAGLALVGATLVLVIACKPVSRSSRRYRSRSESSRRPRRRVGRPAASAARRSRCR